MKVTIFVFSLLAMITLTACQKATDTMTEPDHNTAAITDTSAKIDHVTTMPAEESMKAASARYTEYQADAAQNQKHILFFYANWCPTCIKWDKKVTKNLASLNDKVVIYKVNYDTENDLKSQYEITKQSTAVFVNADGSVAKKELDPSLDSLNTFFAQ